MLRVYNGDMQKLEDLNLKAIEKPIAKELGEPTRKYYDDISSYKDMQNSTHFITKAPHPWWHYIFPWKWFSTRITDYNTIN